MSQANKSQSTSNNNSSSSAPTATNQVSSTPNSSSAAGNSKLSHPPHPSLPIPHSSPRVHSSPQTNDVVSNIVNSAALLALSSPSGSPHASANTSAVTSAQPSPSEHSSSSISIPNSANSSTASTASTTPSSAASAASASVSAASTPASNISVTTTSSTKSLHTQNSENALWVGDLDPSVDEHALVSGLFSSVSSSIIHSKIIRDKVSGLSRGYGFIEFADRMDADRVIREYNGKEVEGTQGKRKYKLNWASGGEQEKKANANATSANSSPAAASPASSHNTAVDDNAIAVFIGDLSSDVSDQLLEAVFRQRYSSVVNGRVVMDGVTNKSKGFGFVRFREENEARHAIETMQGTIIGSRAIRLSNATPKRNQQSSQHHAHNAQNHRAAGQSHGVHGHAALNQSRGVMMNAGGVAVIHDPENAHNNTVFVGGLDETTNSDQIREAFSSFGIILNITIPLNKGCAFVEYDNHLAAANAIGSLHQTKVGTSIIRCTWGKRNAKRGNNPNVNVPSTNGAQGTSTAASTGGNFGVFPYSHHNLIGPQAAAAAYGYDAFNTFNAYPAYAAAAAAYPSYEYLNGGQNHAQTNQPDTANAAAAAFYPPFAAATAAYDPNQYNLHFPHAASFAGYAHNNAAEVNPAFNNPNAADPTHGNAAFSAVVNANVNALNERKDVEAVRQPARLVDVRAKDQILNSHQNAQRTWQQHPRPQNHPNVNANVQIHGHPRQQHPQTQQHGFRGYHPNASHEGISA